MNCNDVEFDHENLLGEVHDDRKYVCCSQSKNLLKTHKIYNFLLYLIIAQAQGL